MTNMVNMTNIEQSKRAVELRSSRFVVMLTETELSAIDDYRFSRRMGTKAEAVRILIEKGLEAEREATAGDNHVFDSPPQTGLDLPYKQTATTKPARAE